MISMPLSNEQPKKRPARPPKATEIVKAKNFPLLRLIWFSFSVIAVFRHGKNSCDFQQFTNFSLSLTDG
jgi:hypothetical protein